MDLRVEDRGEALLVTVKQERIDAACAIQFKDRVREAVATDHERVVMDMSCVRFLDSSGLGAVVAAMKLLGPERKLELASLTPAVAKVFRLTRMESVFKLHKTVDEAFGKDASAA
ncbi:hypothetical protein ACMU_02975 [Actibacterium mucosum KCTC 23349]|uniref:Anti-sigma factor antagonist n=1 Tax=Actibacterium mucosum KCTC 23349 TaxID=1454373 RepID=A0A037ZN30_9RHOB|nr:STAS domain-containing protein [Actibacterium mucosum]KAJ57484.1 hypothetical protein ACMU_02975 [Actibacterium mucosum KCTC 23349]